MNNKTAVKIIYNICHHYSSSRPSMLLSSAEGLGVIIKESYAG
jgi:hypothetical protein